MEKILFVSFHTRSVAIKIMSNILRKDYLVDVLFFIEFEITSSNNQQIKINYPAIKKLFYNYKYVLITVNNYSKIAVLNILKNMDQEIRNKIILGGPTIIINPDYFSGLVSHLCFWEGENIGDYLKHIKSNDETPNFNKSKIYQQVNNLNNVPLQNIEFNQYYFHIKNKIIVKNKFDYNKGCTIETIRGCPFSCSFCNNKRYNQIKQSNNLKLIRKKGLNRVFTELKFIKAKKFCVVDITDDNFFLRDLEGIKEFVLRYNKEINLTLHLNLDLRSKDFLRKFQEISNIKANLSVHIGIQNGDEYFRKNEFNRAMRNRTIITLNDGMNKIKPEKLKIIYEFIWGHPKETESTIINTINIMKLLKGEIRLYIYTEWWKSTNNNGSYVNISMSTFKGKSFLYVQMILFAYLHNRNINIRKVNPIRNKIFCKVFSNYAFSKIYQFLLFINFKSKRSTAIKKIVNNLKKFN